MMGSEKHSFVFYASRCEEALFSGMQCAVHLRLKAGIYCGRFDLALSHLFPARIRATSREIKCYGMESRTRVAGVIAVFDKASPIQGGVM